MEHKRYRGRRGGEIFRAVCRGLSLLGFLVTIAAGGADDTVSTVTMAVTLGAGLATFAGFGYLGGLFR